MIAPAMVFGWWLAGAIPVGPARAHASIPTGAEVAAAEAASSAGTSSERKSRSEPGAAALAALPSDRASFKGTITPAMVRIAHSFLDLPMGAERALEVEGKQLIFVLEWHYHPPGFVGGPNGWHKGVTIYEEKTAL